MIFIAARFRVLAEHADAWPEITRSFTEATRAEPGNLWFDWSREPRRPAGVRPSRGVPGRRGRAARAVRPLQAGAADLPAYLEATPRIINAQLEGTEWSELGELAVDR